MCAMWFLSSFMTKPCNDPAPIAFVMPGGGMRFSGYIFDVEGTLVDSIRQNLLSLQDALTEFGIAAAYDLLQLYSGLDGLQRKLAPPPSADTPYEAKADFLPRTLSEALAALRDDAYLKRALGEGFVDYYCRIKEAEIARFQLEVSEWEQREYFDLF